MSSTPDDNSNALHVELPKRVPLIAMTAEEIHERARKIKTKLDTQKIQSDMILQQKQQEANCTELQALVQ
jgi:hypothetical protein